MILVEMKKPCPEQDRLRDLLTDTITLLCKNGLPYKKEFTVEALIGITLDSQDVFLVNIKEIVKSALASQDEAAGDAEVLTDTDTDADSKTGSQRARKRKSSLNSTEATSGLKQRRTTDYDGTTGDEQDDRCDNDYDGDGNIIKHEDDGIHVKAEPGTADYDSNFGQRAGGYSSVNNSQMNMSGQFAAAGDASWAADDSNNTVQSDPSQQVCTISANYMFLLRTACECKHILPETRIF